MFATPRPGDPRVNIQNRWESRIGWAWPKVRQARHDPTQVAIWSLRERPARILPSRIGSQHLDQTALKHPVHVLVGQQTGHVEALDRGLANVPVVADQPSFRRGAPPSGQGAADASGAHVRRGQPLGVRLLVRGLGL